MAEVRINRELLTDLLGSLSCLHSLYPHECRPCPHEQRLTRGEGVLNRAGTVCDNCGGFHPTGECP